MTAHAGTAEAIPLPAGSLDVVTVGQAFHWFDGDRALAEIHRVLAPRGGLGIVFNVRDTTVPWVARLSELMEPHRGDAPAQRTGAWREAFERTTLFEPLRHSELRHVHHLTPEGVVARVASVSFIAALPGPSASRCSTRCVSSSPRSRDPRTRGGRAALPDRRVHDSRRLTTVRPQASPLREERVGVDVVEPAEEVALGSASVEP